MPDIKPCGLIEYLSCINSNDRGIIQEAPDFTITWPKIKYKKLYHKNKKRNKYKLIFASFNWTF
ncbi:hypothetical protein CDQ84_10070 [Clostridium thermosuccinogenes]|uniref:Uncharacterized protein n=1 Tax=Clostridium thermosuccinogenes TaxID=84032 RepID=A0A2K2F140_9CLOT|nr:hypothetical protein CDO33_10510 [Pseudoclostridium thermosuccinogenes]PNT92501.1 hypothetical protein CDQ83_02730 [Pseudoclostridium thermosuccinogenes]PNT97017.1 hypothetical protein CDQ85_09920 [Pseudoclostridium thermosuccinogenes]PNT98876.1 hypothetical protein CDQ84_10070 [Pseudoclostridium thermosuccinogenes]